MMLYTSSQCAFMDVPNVKRFQFESDVFDMTRWSSAICPSPHKQPRKALNLVDPILSFAACGALGESGERDELG